jgi:hypothetical protein
MTHTEAVVSRRRTKPARFPWLTKHEATRNICCDFELVLLHVHRSMGTRGNWCLADDDRRTASGDLYTQAKLNRVIALEMQMSENAAEFNLPNIMNICEMKNTIGQRY